MNVVHVVILSSAGGILSVFVVGLLYMYWFVWKERRRKAKEEEHQERVERSLQRMFSTNILPYPTYANAPPISPRSVSRDRMSRFMGANVEYTGSQDPDIESGSSASSSSDAPAPAIVNIINIGTDAMVDEDKVQRIVREASKTSLNNEPVGSRKGNKQGRRRGSSMAQVRKPPPLPIGPPPRLDDKRRVRNVPGAAIVRGPSISNLRTFRSGNKS